MTGRRVGRIVTKIGQRAGVVVDRREVKTRERLKHPKTGKPTKRVRVVDKERVKYASAHDLRRGFGTRWSRRVKPAVLKQLMRQQFPASKKTRKNGG